MRPMNQPSLCPQQERPRQFIFLLATYDNHHRRLPLKPQIAIMAEQLVLRGTLEGHSGWVTSLATSLEKCV